MQTLEGRVVWLGPLKCWAQAPMLGCLIVPRCSYPLRMRYWPLAWTPVFEVMLRMRLILSPCLARFSIVPPSWKPAFVESGALGPWVGPSFGSRVSMWLIPPIIWRKMTFFALPKPGPLRTLLVVATSSAAKPARAAPWRTVTPSAALAQRSQKARRLSGSREF